MRVAISLWLLRTHTERTCELIRSLKAKVFLFHDHYGDPSRVNPSKLQLELHHELRGYDELLSDMPIQVLIGNAEQMGKLVAEFCEDNHIEVYLDRSPGHCEKVKRRCPGAWALTIGGVYEQH